MGFVYRIKNTITQRSYIGSTINIESRKQRHFHELKEDKHHSVYLQRSYNKHGANAFVFEVLYTGDDYIEVEQQLIREFFNASYNVSRNASGGDNISYHPRNAEIREIQRANMIERMKDPIERAKCASHGSDNGNWKDGSMEKHETCDCGNWKEYSAITCIQCRDRSGNKNPFYGKEHSNETKRKISESKKGTMPVNANKVEVDGIEYQSQSKAAKAIGVSVGTMSNRIKSDKFPTYKSL